MHQYNHNLGIDRNTLVRPATLQSVYSHPQANDLEWRLDHNHIDVDMIADAQSNSHHDVNMFRSHLVVSAVAIHVGAAVRDSNFEITSRRCNRIACRLYGTCNPSIDNDARCRR